MPEEKRSKRSHRRKENRVIRPLLLRLPRTSRRILLSDWEELMASKTLDAELMWEIDKLEMVLQQKDYIRAGHGKNKLAGFEEGLKFSPLLRDLAEKYSEP